MKQCNLLLLVCGKFAVDLFESAGRYICAGIVLDLRSNRKQNHAGAAPDLKYSAWIKVKNIALRCIAPFAHVFFRNGRAGIAVIPARKIESRIDIAFTLLVGRIPKNFPLINNLSAVRLTMG